MQIKKGGSKEKIVNGELIIDDEQFRTNNNGVTIKKVLAQFYEDKLFAWCLDTINLTMIAILLIIYVIRA